MRLIIETHAAPADEGSARLVWASDEDHSSGMRTQSHPRPSPLMVLATEGLGTLYVTSIGLLEIMEATFD